MMKMRNEKGKDGFGSGESYREKGEIESGKNNDQGRSSGDLASEK